MGGGAAAAPPDSPHRSPSPATRKFDGAGKAGARTPRLPDTLLAPPAPAAHRPRRRGGGAAQAEWGDEPSRAPPAPPPARAGPPAPAGAGERGRKCPLSRAQEALGGRRAVLRTPSRRSA